MNKNLLKQIYAERLAQKQVPVEFDLSKICFPEQLAFITDPRPFITADCSRRAGKSVGCAADLLFTANSNPGVVCLYITLTKDTARRLVWKELISLNEKYNFGAKFNKARLIVTLPNKSEIYLSGCSTIDEIEKFRGMYLKLVYIDEAQSFKSFIRQLVDEILAPALMDLAGSLKIIGTPPPTKNGFFYEVVNNSEYSHHSWTFFQNPHIAIKSGMSHIDILNRELKRRGVSIDDPSIQREWFGKWTDDIDALVFRYDPIKNHFESKGNLTEFVIGIDVGFKDADAIAVLGWNKYEKNCYLVEEVLASKQDITSLAEQIEKLYKKYSPLKMVIDSGGLGLKLAEELRKRFSLPVVAAEKSRKIEFIEILNDGLRTGKLFIKRDSYFAKDAMLIEWDYEKSTPDKRVIKKEPHSDIADALLYAYRESLHWTSEAPKPRQPLMTNWVQYSEKQLYEAVEERERLKEQEEKEKDFQNISEIAWDSDNFQLEAAKYYINKNKGIKYGE